jgi:hypothetical protein
MFRAKHHLQQETSRYHSERRTYQEHRSRAHDFLWEFGGAPEHLGLPRPAASGEGVIELIGSLDKALAFAG